MTEATFVSGVRHLLLLLGGGYAWCHLHLGLDLLLLSKLLLLQSVECGLWLDLAEAWLRTGWLVFVVLGEHGWALDDHVLGIGLLLELRNPTGGVTMHLMGMATLAHLLLLLLRGRV